ncbi:MAG TPA: Wzz/FepE/Etk N-terminal domain-containing protein [Gaiellaceae bacterium]
MSADRNAVDLGAEREIDLRKWRDALVARWWIVGAGLAAGIVVGALYGLSGGSTFTASALIAPGQAFNPSGNTQVQTYLTSQSAINAIATSNTTLEEAANKAGIGVGQLRGHVSTSAIDQNTGTASSTTTRNAVLVQITVQLPKKKKAEDAANAIALIVKQTTTSKYVKQSITIIANRITGFIKRQASLQKRLNSLTAALGQQNLDLNEKLLLTIQADQAQATFNQTQDALLTAQQQQILSQQIETTQIIQAARGQKTTARSRRNSVVVGALIGILLGAIVATYVGLRGPRPAAV